MINFSYQLPLASRGFFKNLNFPDWGRVHNPIMENIDQRTGVMVMWSTTFAQDHGQNFLNNLGQMSEILAMNMAKIQIHGHGYISALSPQSPYNYTNINSLF